MPSEIAPSPVPEGFWIGFGAGSVSGRIARLRDSSQGEISCCTSPSSNSGAAFRSKSMVDDRDLVGELGGSTCCAWGGIAELMLPVESVGD